MARRAASNGSRRGHRRLTRTADEHDVVVDESFLAWFLMWSNQGGFASLSEIGAAADALEAGDEAPLLRLAAEHDFNFVFSEGAPKAFSAALNWARYCTDVPFAWDKSAPLATRQAQFEAARDALPDDTFAPFSVEGLARAAPRGRLRARSLHPVAGARRACRARFAQRDFPADVPALIMTGDLDLDTPTAEAEKLQAAWPGSELIEIENAEHTPATTAQFECAAKLTRGFMKNLALGDTSCAADRDTFPSRRAGTSLRWRRTRFRRRFRKSGTDESTELDRKVATAAVAAITDAVRRAFLQQNGEWARASRRHLRCLIRATGNRYEAPRMRASRKTSPSRATASTSSAQRRSRARWRSKAQEPRTATFDRWRLVQLRPADDRLQDLRQDRRPRLSLEVPAS